jgi:hypothetical protein
VRPIRKEIDRLPLTGSFSLLGQVSNSRYYTPTTSGLVRLISAPFVSILPDGFIFVSSLTFTRADR